MELSAQTLISCFNNYRLIDVRAPIEYLHMSVPHSINLPLLNDEERALVGTTYKAEGQHKAIEVGSKLVAGPIRQRRLKGWVEEVARIQADRKIPILCCHRGGLRSQLVQKTLSEEFKMNIPLVEGGIKAIRRALIQTLENFEYSEVSNLLAVVCGHTGAGKTAFLSKRPLNSIDLEALAEHRGSAFGLRPGAVQPSQATFENRLAVRLIELESVAKTGARIWVEDESRTIGKLILPKSLFHRMMTAPAIRLKRERRARAQSLVKLYFDEDFGLSEKTSTGTTQGPLQTLKFAEDLILSRIDRISAKLGGAETRALKDQVRSAFEVHAETMDILCHTAWVERLLERYYDPLYEKSSRSV